MSEFKNKNGLTEKEFLAQYNPGNYERPSVTADMLVFTVDAELNNLKVLLIKRGDHPYMNCWALPGGFVGINESAFEAANRELKEETGLEDIYLEQLYTYTRPNRDPRMRVITVAYMALIPMTEAVAGDDAADAAWFDIFTDNNILMLKNEEKNVTIEYQLKDTTFANGAIKYNNYVPELISKEKLAFDHDSIILDGIIRLRNKAEYTDIVFNLMGEQFTLPDLQRVYEIVLGEPLYKKNFRDKIKGKIVEISTEGKSITGKRLATMYKYNKED